MRVEFSRRFIKDFKKCSKNIQIAFRERLALLADDKFHPRLNNHALSGEYNGCRSINITGDWRAVFQQESDSVYFVAIGTHGQLYR